MDNPPDLEIETRKNNTEVKIDVSPDNPPDLEIETRKNNTEVKIDVSPDNPPDLEIETRKFNTEVKIDVSPDNPPDLEIETRKNNTEVKIDVSPDNPPDLEIEARRNNNFSYFIKSINKKVTPRNLRVFYEKQNQLINNLIEDEKRSKGTPEEEKNIKESQLQFEYYYKKRAAFCTNLSFYMNIILVCVKIFASIWTLSLAVVASLIDSFLDVLSGSVLYITSKMIKKTDFDKNPEGRDRLEPLGVVLFAALMGMANVYLITESVQALTNECKETPSLNIDIIAYIILSFVIITKTFLYFNCRKIQEYSSSVKALTQDHLNDILSNGSSFIMVIIAGSSPSLWYLDPITAILISLYVVVIWIVQARQQIDNLIGTTADPILLSRLTYCAMNFSNVKVVDTIRAYRKGPAGFLAEVDIVLPEDMSLKQAHDIGENLEIAMERIDGIQRAIVHLDYETTHKPEYERRRGDKDDPKEKKEKECKSDSVIIPKLNKKSRRLTVLF